MMLACAHIRLVFPEVNLVDLNKFISGKTSRVCAQAKMMLALKCTLINLQLAVTLQHHRFFDSDWLAGVVCPPDIIKRYQVKSRTSSIIYLYFSTKAHHNDHNLVCDCHCHETAGMVLAK